MTDLAGFVLRDLVLGVLLAVLAFAVCAAGLWNVDLLSNPISIAPAAYAADSFVQSLDLQEPFAFSGLLHGFLICSALLDLLARHLDCRPREDSVCMYSRKTSSFFKHPRIVAIGLSVLQSQVPLLSAKCPSHKCSVAVAVQIRPSIEVV